MTWFQKTRSLYVVLVLALSVTLMFTGCKMPWQRGGGGDNPVSPTSPTNGTNQESQALPAGVIISESLKDGQTQGAIDHATLTADGLQLHGGDGFIRFSIPTTPDGYVEFDAKGFVMNELHGGDEFKAVLLTMWDGNAPYLYEVSGYIYELRFFGHISGRADASNTLSIRLISDYDWNEGHRHHYSWDPNRTYRIRLEWGRGVTTVFVDGEAVATSPVARDFRPGNHLVQIGANFESPYSHRWKKSPHDLLISNIMIGTN
jgi:hypothetical protein